MGNNIGKWLKMEPEDWLVKECYKDLSQNEKRVRFELIDKLMLVLADRAPNNFYELKDLLQWEWIQIIYALKVDFENKYAYATLEEAFYDWDLWIESNKYMASLHINTDTWIERARMIFAKNIKPFYSQLATAEDYKKHFSNPNWSDQKIIRESARRALLMPLVDMNLLDKFFVTLSEYFYEAIYHKECFIFIVETDQVWGYSNGVICTHLLFKLDPGQPIYHVYPIHDKEIDPNRKTLVSKEEEGEMQYENYMSKSELTKI